MPWFRATADSAYYNISEGQIYQVSKQNDIYHFINNDGERYDIVPDTFSSYFKPMSDKAEELFDKAKNQVFKEGNVVITDTTPEVDPTARKNQGKIEMSLLPRFASEQEARVWMFGMAKGYKRFGWKEMIKNQDDPIMSAMDSLLRHAFAILDGELYDPESGLPHLAHIKCNASIGLEAMKEDN